MVVPSYLFLIFAPMDSPAAVHSSGVTISSPSEQLFSLNTNLYSTSGPVGMFVGSLVGVVVGDLVVGSEVWYPPSVSM